MSDKGEIPFLEILQRQGLDCRGWDNAFQGFFPAVDEPVFCIFLVRGLAGLKALSADRIPIGHPPSIAPLVEPSR